MMIKIRADIVIPLGNSDPNAVALWAYYESFHAAALFTLRGELNCLENFLTF